MVSLVAELGQLLKETNLTVATAEACTSGLVAYRLCDQPGSSSYFYGGVIAYSRNSKTTVLGVSTELLLAYGSVSREVAIDMAHRVMSIFDADIGISTTGVSGPSGGTNEKPVGLFYVGMTTKYRDELVKELHFNGDRATNKKNATDAALEMLRGYLLQQPFRRANPTDT